MFNLSSKAIIDGNAVLLEFNGALCECYVLQQLKTNSGHSAYYYCNNDSTFEVIFLLDTETGPLPVEVSAEESSRARGFKAFCQKFEPKLAIRASMSDYCRESWMTNVPLCTIGQV